MSNVIQFAPRPGSKLAVHVAADVQICLTIASWYSTTADRTVAIETVLQHCDQPHLTRLALRALGEAV